MHKTISFSFVSISLTLTSFSFGLAFSFFLLLFLSIAVCAFFVGFFFFDCESFRSHHLNVTAFACRFQYVASQESAADLYATEK